MKHRGLTTGLLLMLAALAGWLAAWRPDLMSAQDVLDHRVLMQQGQVLRIIVVAGVVGIAWSSVKSRLTERWSISSELIDRHRFRVLAWYLLIEGLLAIGVFL